MLSLHNVAAGYGTFQALFDVSLDVQGGEAVAVIGPNGAGKTTLLRVISKLIDVAAGAIHMDGRRLNEVPAHQVIELGIAHVPENRRLFPRLTVEENLRIGAFTRAARARFAERLALSTSCSRAFENAASRWPARFRAASSRCARSGVA